MKSVYSAATSAPRTDGLGHTKYGKCSLTVCAPAHPYRPAAMVARTSVIARRVIRGFTTPTSYLFSMSLDPASMLHYQLVVKLRIRQSPVIALRASFVTGRFVTPSRSIQHLDRANSGFRCEPTTCCDSIPPGDGIPPLTALGADDAYRMMVTHSVGITCTFSRLRSQPQS
jgi:hypothetical protein